MTTRRDMPQFMRMDSYARKSSNLRRRNGHRSAWEVTAELVREPHASPHVENQLPPTILRGNPASALETANRMADEARDPRGHRQRRDAHVLAGCICSYPVSVAEVRADQEEQHKYGAWVGKCIEWADSEFGDPQIGAIVLHLDETFPHLHIMLTPPAPGVEPSPLRRAGKAAVSAATDKKHLRKIERQAYKVEARRLQDSFHSSVSIYFGHTRHGRVSRKRLSPRERSIEIQQAHALREAHERAAAIDAQSRQQLQLLASQQSRLEQQEKALEALEADLNERDRSLRIRAELTMRPVKQIVNGILKAMLGQLPDELRPEIDRAAAKAMHHVYAGTEDAQLEANCSPGHGAGDQDVSVTG